MSCVSLCASQLVKEMAAKAASDMGLSQEQELKQELTKVGEELIKAREELKTLKEEVQRKQGEVIGKPYHTLLVQYV